MATSNVGQGGVHVLPGSAQPSYPQWFGFFYALVASNADPLGIGRIQVRVPQVLGTELSAWAWALYSAADAAAGTGTTAGTTGTTTSTTTQGTTTATTGTAATAGTAGTATASATVTPPAVGTVVVVTFIGGDLGNPAYLLLYNSVAAGTAATTTSGVTSTAAGASTATSTGSGAPTVNTASLSPASSGTSYSQLVNASGGFAPYTYSVTSGSLPSGITLNSSSGILSGSSTATGAHAFTVTVTDSANSTASQALTLAVTTPMAITQTSLPAGQPGVAYSQTLTATGGTGTGFAWSVSSGALPSWASLNASTGVLSGTPASGGTATFTAKVTDSIGDWATQSYSLAYSGPAVGSSIIKYKPAITTRASTTTLALDPDLQVSVLANAVYVVQVNILYFGTSTAPGIQWEFQGPSGASFYFTQSQPYNTTGYSENQWGELGVPGTAPTDGNALGLLIAGTLGVGSAAGTFGFLWAQETSSADSLIMYLGSYMTLTRVA
jgi:Putative Ig domain